MTSNPRTSTMHRRDVNLFIHKYVIAVAHAVLWLAALSLAAYFHLNPGFSHAQALLGSTLMAYCAYVCESGLGTWRVAAHAQGVSIDFRKAGLWRWVTVNVMVAVTLSLLFLHNPTWWLILLVILNAGWQKYMNGRIPPRLQATFKPLQP